MADNFSDKVVKKLQKQNLAVDLTEEVVEEAAPETAPEVAPEVAPQEVAAQSQDFQAMTANSGNPGTGIKDIVVIPGGGTTQASTSQINFYWEKPTTQGTDNTDAFPRSTIYNYVEGADGSEESVLAIGGYNGTHYAPATNYGGGSGQAVARIWFHPFSGTVDAAKLVLEQVANTAAIRFGTGTVTQTTITSGHLGWTGTRLVIGDGGAAQEVAYRSDLTGSQNTFSNMTDGTTTSAADNSTDTFRFRGSNGVTVLVTNDETTFGDNLLISLSSVPNGALANSSITIGSTGIDLGGTTATLSGLTSVSATALLAGNIRINSVAGQIDTSSNALTLTSANSTVSITATNVTLAGTTATISANSNRIQGVATPSAGTDAANKSYVDGLIQGLDVHDAVRAISVAAINTSVLYFQTNAPSSVSGAATGVCYIESSANQVLSPAYFDNITLNVNDRILVTAGATTATYNIGGATSTPAAGVNVMNGVYVVTSVGSGASKWRLDRASDSDDNLELEGGTFVFVQEGDVYKDTGWLVSNNTLVTKLSFGSDAITFTQFSSAGQIEAGNGLLKNGNVINAQGTTSRISVSADNIDIDVNYVGQGTITTLGTISSGTWNATTISVAKGGTGISSFTDKGVFYANGTTTIGFAAASTTAQLLISNGSNVPTFVSMSGGEATISATGAFALSTTGVTASTYGTATNVPQIAVDTKGRVTGVTNVAIPTATSSVQGLASFSASHFSVASGAVSLSTVAITSGGTGATSFTGNGVLYGGSPLQSTVAGIDGQILVGTTSNAPIFRTVSGDAQITNLGALTLNTTGVTASTYGSATNVAQIVVDAKGRITSASNVAINLSTAAGVVTANNFFAAPDATNNNPTFRAIVLSDLPTISIGKGGTNTTGQTNNGITYFNSTSIVSGGNLTFNPTNNGATASSALYVNAGSATTGTAMYVNAGALAAGNVLVVNGFGTTGKLISGQTAGAEKFSVDVNGNLRATTKSFDIPHPTKEGKRLVYGVLEGPEHGVYHRGTVEGKDKIKIELPEYWYKLVGENYSVQLTSWGPYAVHLVEKTENYFVIQLSSNLIMRKLKTIKVDYVVHGARLDAPLEIEQ